MTEIPVQYKVDGVEAFSGDKDNFEKHDVLTIDQTAQFLQVSRQTVYKLINEGDIPCRRVGQRWRFSKKALLAWIGQER